MESRGGRNGSSSIEHDEMSPITSEQKHYKKGRNLMRSKVFNRRIAIQAALQNGIKIETGHEGHSIFLVSDEGDKIPLPEHRTDYGPHLTKSIKNFIKTHTTSLKP